MSFLEVQDLATVAAQAELWRLVARCYSECDNVLDVLELAGAALVVALLLKQRKVDL
jgi:hypothetical protein